MFRFFKKIVLFTLLLVAVQERCQASPIGEEEKGRLHAIVLYREDESPVITEDRKDLEGLVLVNLTLPGSFVLLEAKLKNIYENKPLSMELIDKIRQTIALYFRDHGYPLVLVKAPDQEIESGVLELQVKESKLGVIHVEGNKHFSSENLKKYVKLQPGDRINENSLVYNLYAINRNPFRHADFIYLPGQTLGTTDLTLKVRDRKTSRFYTGIENTGVATTGRNRLFAGFNLGNVFKRSDVLGYQYTTSDDFHKFQAHTVQYTTTLPWQHFLDIYGGYAAVNAKLDTFQQGILQADGTTRVVTRTIKGDGFSAQGSARYIIPFFLSRYLLHEIILGFDWKRMNNRTIFGGAIPLAGNNATLTQLVLGYSGDYESNHFRVDFETKLFYSPGTWLPDQTNKDYQELTPKAKKNYVYWHGAMVYLQKLPWDFSIRLQGQAQLSSQNLLPSEEFGLGGYNTVRGYEESVVNKENILLLRGEVRSPPLPVISKKNKRFIDSLQILAFIDYAIGRNKFSFFEAPTSEVLPKQTEWLMGVGPGLRYTCDPYVAARLDWGIKVHKNDIIGRQAHVAHFSVTASY